MQDSFEQYLIDFIREQGGHPPSYAEMHKFLLYARKAKRETEAVINEIINMFKKERNELFGDLTDTDPVSLEKKRARYNTIFDDLEVALEEEQYTWLGHEMSTYDRVPLGYFAPLKRPEKDTKNYLLGHWNFFRQFFKKYNCPRGNFQDFLVLPDGSKPICPDEEGFIEDRHVDGPTFRDMDSFGTYIQNLIEQLLKQMYSKPGDDKEYAIVSAVNIWRENMDTFPLEKARAHALHVYAEIAKYDVDYAK